MARTNRIWSTPFLMIMLFSSAGKQASAALSFKEACRDLYDASIKSAYLDGACLVVDFAELLTQTAARLRCIALYDRGQLAATFDQKRISDIGAILDLSNSVWTKLVLTVENKTAWFDDVMNNTVSDPSWATQYPDPNKGLGVVLRHDGLVTVEPDSIHPFLCEFFDNPGYIQFKSVAANAKSSNALLSESNAVNMHDCGVSCVQEPRCRSYAFSSSQNQCQLFWLFGNSLTLKGDSDFRVMTRIPSDQDCVDPNVCLPELPKMLIIGGNLKKSIESYYMNEPSKNQVVANLTDTLGGPVAVVMLDGRIMIAGGDSDGDTEIISLSKTIIFDPKTNSFTPSPDMLEGRFSAAASLLSGAVVVCGGFNSEISASSSTCEQFTNGLWSTMTSLTYARHDHQLINVADHLYAIGGYDFPTGNTVTATEKFDKVTGVWSTVAPMLKPRFLFGAALLHDQLYTCGKYYGATTDQICNKYDPMADQWSSIAPSAIIRSHPVMVAFQGKLYIFGGDVGGVNEERSVEVYNPETDEWSAATDVIEDRKYPAAVVVM